MSFNVGLPGIFKHHGVVGRSAGSFDNMDMFTGNIAGCSERTEILNNDHLPNHH